MVGIRKLLVVAAIIAISATVDLTEVQADVLISVLYTFIAANAVEHLTKGDIGEKIMGFFGGRNRPGSGDSGAAK